MNYLQSEEYIDYLKKHYEVRGFGDEKDATFPGAGIDIFLGYSKLLSITKEHKVLEIGCGLGRLLKELFDSYNCKIFGVDKNSKAIELAKIRIGKISEELRDDKAETISFPEEYFDRIICWGVFELCNQEKTLLEMTRRLNVRGLILLTGKSHTYHYDDQEAYAAEVAITEKKMDYNFTNYDEMIKFGLNIGLEPIHQRFFERRGDFANNKPSQIKPENFYEWLIVFRKNKKTSLQEDKIIFNRTHSITYERKVNG